MSHSKHLHMYPLENPLTPSQKLLLDTIKSFRQAHGVMPTMQESADLMGISKVSVFEKMRVLERKGAITRIPKMPRGYRVVDTPAVRLAALVLAKYAQDEEATALARQVAA